MSRVLIWCHGGCFSGGSVEYDKELRAYLIDQCRCIVIPVNFSLNGWNEAIDDILKVAKEMLDIMSDEYIVIGGISSGALLAHEVANRLNLPALLICPVIKPASRHSSLPDDLKEKQLKFFGTLDYMKYIQNKVAQPNSARYILYGLQDNRAPSSAFEHWLKLDNVASNSIDKGHEICNSPPLKLIGEHLNDLFLSRKKMNGSH